MVAVAEAGMARAAAEGETTPPPPPPSAVLTRRDPTPDHPPYSWMIGEAIGALSEDGGSAEAAISVFIRGKYPGVPAAHDRLLRYYLAKHVDEGFFVCTAPGRYSRHPDEPALLEEGPAAKASSEMGSSGSPAAEAKRGRGRPRKDGSPPSSTPKRPGRPLKPAQPRDTNKKDGGEAMNHGRPRELADDGSATALVAVNDGGEASPATPMDNGHPGELAPVATAAPVSASTPVTENKDGSAPSTTPGLSTQPCNLPLVAAGEGSAPSLVADKNKNDGGQATSATRKRRRRHAALCSIPASVADKKDGTAPASAAGGKAPSSTPKGRNRRRKRDGDDTAALSVSVKPHGQPRKLYPLGADKIPDNPTCCVLALPA